MLQMQQNTNNDNNVMSHLIKTSHPYFTRTEILEPGLQSQKRLYDKYDLLSIAKNNIVGQQIFRTHFCDIFSKHQQKQRAQLQRLERDHFSSFFMTFIEIFTLRSLMGKYVSCTGLVRGILKDVFREKYREESEQQQAIRKSKYVFMENHLNNLIQADQIKNILKPSEEQEEYLKKAIEIETRITFIIEQLKQQLEDAVKFKRMLQKQYYHDQLSHKSLKRAILYGFKCISNIQAMRRSFKKDIWQQFQQIYKHYMPISIDLLAKQTNREGYDTIYLPSYSREIEPIISPLLNHLQNLHRNQPNKLILAELAKSIVEFCAKFHNNTKGCYPRISIRDIYMDMKKLAPVISYNALLLDAIGLTKNTKSFELRLATEQTPDFDFEETYLETDSKTLLKLYRKYYDPFNHNQLKQDHASNSQRLEIYRQQLAILQQIHVGRLINIVYFISNNRHFSHDYYKGMFSQSSNKPLYFKLYAESLKECYERESEGQLTLEEIIPLPGSANNINQDVLPKATLSFQRLAAHFGIQFNEDSLIEGLKSQRFKQQIYQRHLIMKELTVLIFGKSAFAFRKLPNPVKYLFICFATNYQEIRFLLQSRKELVKLSREMKGSKGYQFLGLIKAEAMARMRQEMNVDIYKVSLSKEQAKKKKTKRDACNKILDYKGRNDSSGEFFKANQHYLNKIQEINKDFDVLYSLLRLEEDLIMEFQAANSQLNYQLDEIDCAFACKDQKMDKLVHQVLAFREGDKKQSEEILENIMRQFKQHLDKQITAKLQELNRNIFQTTSLLIIAEIQQNFSKAQRLHDYPDSLKDNKARWLEYCRYFNLRFKALTSVLLSFKPCNSRKYRSIFRSHLLDDKVVFSKQQSNGKIPVHSDVSLSIKRMEMIIQKCEAELKEKAPYLP